MTVQTRVTLNILNLNCTMYTNSLIDILILFFFFKFVFLWTVYIGKKENMI